uniref:Uncharacterized protein n=1 Tax=Arundo donax TaxID=35708 RepID=A0A0A9H843_ARUDO
MDRGAWRRLEDGFAADVFVRLGTAGAV